MATTEYVRCPVCGETDPWPRWICLTRATRAQKPGEPCDYSLEGHERTFGAHSAPPRAGPRTQMPSPLERRAARMMGVGAVVLALFAVGKLAGWW